MNSAFLTTSVIAAALARPPRRTPTRRVPLCAPPPTPCIEIPKKSTNNYLAEGLRRRPGAPPGNRNAVTHGLRSAARRARRDHIRALIARSDALCRELRAVTRRARAIRKAAAAKRPHHDPRTPLPVRHDAARRGADPGRGFLGGGQAPDRARPRRPRPGLHRGR